MVLSAQLSQYPDPAEVSPDQIWLVSAAEGPWVGIRSGLDGKRRDRRWDLLSDVGISISASDDEVALLAPMTRPAVSPRPGDPAEIRPWSFWLTRDERGPSGGLSVSVREPYQPGTPWLAMDVETGLVRNCPQEDIRLISRLIPAW